MATTKKTAKKADEAKAVETDTLTEDLFDRAVEAHARWCKIHGSIVDQPSFVLSEMRNGKIVLANVNGDLGPYIITASGRLRRVEAGVE